MRHGFDYDARPWPSGYPELRAAGNVDEVLRNIPVQVPVAGRLPQGFVLDADRPLASRWAAVRDRLGEVGVQTPPEPAAEGFVGRAERYRVDVGVWLMPDNRRDGKLETFLADLMGDPDPLAPHAQRSTQAARAHGAAFSDHDEVKAVVRCWLAWQREPGLPYGTAIRARYLRHDSPAAEAFVRWFRTLYGAA